MSEAKANGRSQSRIFDSAVSARAMKRLSLEMELRRAVENSSLEVYYQPKYQARSLRFLGGEALLPVINLPLLAALTPPGHEITIIDENVQLIDFDLCARADIVGLTGMNVQRVRMHAILDELKARGVFTVIGGPWVTVHPSDFGDQPDAIFIGEAEETWPRFLIEWAEYAPESTVISLAMTRQDIADFLELTMKTVSRTLSQLERDALIEIRTARQIPMKNLTALRNLN